MVRIRLATAVAAIVATLAAPQARADPAGPLLAVVDAAAERLQIAEPVAAYKWSAHAAIEDRARVEQELVALREDAVSAQVDPDYVARIFGDQISATEAIEYSRLADWKLDPAGIAPAPPDLAASRAAIDALNTKILSQVSLNWSLLQTPQCAAGLDDARTATIRARRLDNLYQRALTTATRSYCQPQPPT
jgi:chorismate mutase